MIEKVVTEGGPFGGFSLAIPSHKLGLSRPEVSRNVITGRDGALRARPGFETTVQNAFAVPANSDLTALGRAIGSGGTTYGIYETRSVGGDRYVYNDVGHRSAVASNHYGRPWLVGDSAYVPTSGGLAKLPCDGAALNGAAWALVAGGDAVKQGTQTLVTPWDQRMMVVGQFATGQYGRIVFSEPGNFGNWPATNYEQFGGPSDGVYLQGGCVWRNLVLVWSMTEAWVIYGTGTNAVGGPELQWRKVATPGSQILSACAGPDGVYLLTDDGFHRSQGGDFRSFGDDALRGLWSVVQSRAYGVRYMTNTVNRVVGEVVYNGTRPRVLACGQLMAIAFGGHAITTAGTSTPHACLFVLDTATGLWSFWTGAFVAGGTVMSGQGMVLGAIGTNQVMYQFTADTAGADAISDPEDVTNAMWQSGPIEAGGPAHEWTARELQLLGSGAVGVSLVTDDVNVPAAATVQMGAGSGYGFTTTQAAGYHRAAARGQRIAVRLSGFTPQTSVRRLVLLGESVRDPTMRATGAG